MKNIFLNFLFLTLLFPCTVFSQNSKSFIDFVDDLNRRGVLFGTNVTPLFNSYIEDSQYLNSKFLKGEVLMQDSLLYSGIPMRYNCSNDEIEVQFSDTKIYTLNSTSGIIQVNINSDIIVFKGFIMSGAEKKGYLFELYKGSSALYKRIYKVYQDGIPSKGIVPETPPGYVEAPKEYYIGLKDGPAVLCSSKSDLLKILRNHTIETESYIKKQRLKINNEKDLINILTWFDSLN